jgi:branched-chain amino acid transport system permease protein
VLYREAGQFKTSYAADRAIFPIIQDRWFIIAVLVAAYVVVPFVASPYLLVTILIPSLIFCIAALGLNVLTGYAGQLSLGTGGFMAVGAYATFKMTTMFPELNIIVIFLISGLFAAAVGVVFGIPSLRIKGFYLAVATLAAQFFLIWLFNRVGWFSNYDPSGTISIPPRDLFGVRIAGSGATPVARYLVVLTLVVMFALLVKNLVRSRMGRMWMAVRDMDIAAEIMGIRLMTAKLSAFAISSYLCGVAGALYFALYLRTVETIAFDVVLSFLVLFMIIVGGLGSVLGSILGAFFIIAIPILLTRVPETFGIPISVDMSQHLEVIIFGSLIIFFLIVEPHGLARLWQIAKEKLRRWPFPY